VSLPAGRQGFDSLFRHMIGLKEVLRKARTAIDFWTKPDDDRFLFDLIQHDLECRILRTGTNKDPSGIEDGEYRHTLTPEQILVLENHGLLKRH